MPWDMTITHFDVRGAGDSTLIVATNAEQGLAKSVLIDGGLKGALASVYNGIKYLAAGDIDVLVATHYDKDHLQGLTGLFSTDAVKSVRVYDPGEVGTVTSRSSQRTSRVLGDDNKFIKTPEEPIIAWDVMGREPDFAKYIAAIEAAENQGKTVLRLTERVMSDRNVVIPQGLRGTFHPSQILVGREIMWDTSESLGQAATAPPDGAPKLTCIAANQYVLAPGGKPTPASRPVLGLVDIQNVRSLGFLLEFGRFRYYVGGDLETPEEDQLLPYLAAASAGGAAKLHVFKTSHHGSAESTSDLFVQATDPNVAVISCGSANQHQHPRQRVLDTLEANKVDYYLTGSGWDGLVVGRRGVVCGSGNGTGNIFVMMDEAQAAEADYEIVYRRPSGRLKTEEYS